MKHYIIDLQCSPLDPQCNPLATFSSILLCLTPDDFTCQGKSPEWQRVNLGWNDIKIQENGSQENPHLHTSREYFYTPKKVALFTLTSNLLLPISHHVGLESVLLKYFAFSTGTFIKLISIPKHFAN